MEPILASLAQLCLAPMLVLGGLSTLQPNKSHVSDFDGAFIEVQSCSTGFGVHGFASSSGLLAGGIQYGLTIPLTDALTVTIQPRFGVSHTLRQEIPELPLQTQFWTGAALFLSYEGVHVGALWGHASNAGLHQHNAGLDVVGGFVGVTL